MLLGTSFGGEERERERLRLEEVGCSCNPMRTQRCPREVMKVEEARSLGCKRRTEGREK